MEKNEYKFDIAFSFLNKDEGIALQLNNLLNDRFKCFIYTEQQMKLAGTNGETTFNRVFSIESKIVVILYRMEWGKTNWTRIEETAIRNRGYEEGYDFVLLIPLDDIIDPPAWLPKNRLWIGLNRYGIKDAASVIGARVSEMGGNVREDSFADKIATLESETKKRRNNDRFLKSDEGKKAGFDEFEAIVEKVKANADEIKSRNPKWNLRVWENRQNCIDLLSYGYQLSIKYDVYSADPFMSITFLDGYLDREGHNDILNSAKMIDHKDYKFDINKSDQRGWLDVETQNKFITTSSLITLWFEKLMKYTISKR